MGFGGYSCLMGTLEKENKKLKVISWQFKVQWESHRTSLVAYTESHLLQQDDKETG